MAKAVASIIIYCRNSQRRGYPTRGGSPKARSALGSLGGRCAEALPRSVTRRLFEWCLEEGEALLESAPRPRRTEHTS